MNKTLSMACSVILLSTLLTGCVATPPGPSVASLGMGSDAAAINAGRGRADAQMTRAQAEQYSLQQQIISQEMALEQQKRQNTINNTRSLVQGVGDVVNILGAFSH